MDHDEEKKQKLPHGVALSWGLVKPSRRGPKRELSIEQIVDAAIVIADEQGLQAVSMNRVASSLGFSTMSLYRYFQSKDDLILLMQDAAARDIPATSKEAGDDWRENMRAFVYANLEIYTAHLWFLETPIYSVPMTPNSLKFVDWALGGMRMLPINNAEKMSFILLLSSYARACGIIKRDMIRANHAGTDTDTFSGKGYAKNLAKLVTPEHFPYLHSVVASGVYTDEMEYENDDVSDIGNDFDFGLERILDGIDHYLTLRGFKEKGEKNRSHEDN
ncbi:TetR/AcrR family transcriptional regulator [Sporolactobacillus sp. Y61]|uniref:TetR/AcrR family transcriptional regulator n=1 Tax=Sporolactobacillus sp. Y61 TaxID=3160863 RepID=A0AAU8IFY2_9BACL